MVRFLVLEWMRVPGSEELFFSLLVYLLSFRSTRIFLLFFQKCAQKLARFDVRNSVAGTSAFGWEESAWGLYTRCGNGVEFSRTGKKRERGRENNDKAAKQTSKRKRGNMRNEARMKAANKIKRRANEQENRASGQRSSETAPIHIPSS